MADVVEKARELELEVETEGVTELLPCRDKANAEELLLMNKERKWFLQMASTPPEDAVKMVEMATKDLDYYVKLADKTKGAFERINSNFERSSIVGE